MSRDEPSLVLVLSEALRRGTHQWVPVLIREVGCDAVLWSAFPLDPVSFGLSAHVGRSVVGGAVNDDEVRLLRLGRRKWYTTNGLTVRHLGPVAQARCGNITTLANLLQANIGNAVFLCKRVHGL